MSGTRLAIEWHAGWLTAVVVSAEKGRPRLGPGLCAKLPDGVSADDAQAVGQWMGEQVRQAGLGEKRVVWVAGRGDVLLKRLSLPKPPAENQLPAMVRLQMSRAMPMQGDDAATDYAVLGEDGSKLDMLGASVPGERLTWMRSMLSAAKLKLAGVVLRAQCSACAAGAANEGHARIVVSPGASSVEVVVVEPGGVVTSRGIDATWPSGEQEGFVRRIAVEVKRTWMGYRASPQSLPVQGAVVIGGDGLCQAIARAVSDAIEVEADAIDASSIAVLDESAPEPARWLALAGAVAPSCDRIDLLSPKRAVATRSKSRERALLGVMAGIAVVGGLGAFGFIRLGDLEAERSRLETQVGNLGGQYTQLLLDQTRMEHLQALRSSRPAWTNHLERVLGHTTVEGVRLQQLSGVSRGGVWFGNPQGRGQFGIHEGEYRPAVRGALNIQGVGDYRELAGMVRGRLVNDPLYVVQTQGPDAGLSFKLDIETTSRSVPEPEPETEPETEPEAQEDLP